MPGISSGLSPKLIGITLDDPSASNDTIKVPLVKFPTVHTMVDAFAMTEAIVATATADTALFVRIHDGGTTGNATASAGKIPASAATWAVYTGKTRGTNYTFGANDWLTVAFSEVGAVAPGFVNFHGHFVEGNV